MGEKGGKFIEFSASGGFILSFGEEPQPSPQHRFRRQGFHVPKIVGHSGFVVDADAGPQFQRGSAQVSEYRVAGDGKPFHKGVM